MHETAAKCLGIIGPDASAAAPFLVQALRDRQGTVCWTAAAALGKIGKGAVGPLTRALGDNDNVVRHAAAYALGEVGPEAEPAVPVLIHCLLDSNELVQNSAGYSLSTIGTPAVIALFDARRNGDAALSNAVTVVLDKLDAADAGTIRPLIATARSGQVQQRQRAIEPLTLYCSRSALAVKAMTELLRDPLPEIRLAAIEFLNQAGPRAHSATPTLKSLATDPELSVRSAAQQVLAKFDK
jgi:HEAT repeat protein